jgi:hypothetical protein
MTGYQIEFRSIRIIRLFYSGPNYYIQLPIQETL